MNEHKTEHRRITALQRCLSLALVCLLAGTALVPDTPAGPRHTAAGMGTSHDREESGRSDPEGTGSFFFDFGDHRSPVREGYTAITPEDRYESRRGYGLLSDTTSFYVTPRTLQEYSPHVLPRSWVYGEYGNDLTVDGVRSETGVAFRVDLDDGLYRVRLWIGDLEKGIYSMNISFNGQWLVEEAAAFHTVHRSIYFTPPGSREARNYGCAAPFTRDVTVRGGTLVIEVAGNDTAYHGRLEAEGAKDPPKSYLSWMSTGTRKHSTGTGPWRYIGGPFTNASVLGVEIIPVPRLPVTGDPGSLVLDRTNVTDPDIAAAVDALIAGEWTRASDGWNRAMATSLHGPARVARAQLGLFLAGSLNMDRETEILPVVEQDLLEILRENPRDRGAGELLDSVTAFRTGLAYYLERGVPEPGARQQKNHFIESNKAIIHLRNIEPQDPLYPKAMLWCARALYSLDPHRWTSASGTARDIMEALRPRAPDNPYIRFYLDTERDVPRTWENGTAVLSTTGQQDRWYLENYTSGFGDAPGWARILREELCWLYDITDWWVDHRQQEDGSIGGGWTDDVEMIGLFGFDALISEGAAPRSLEGAGRFVRGMLLSGQVDMERGYSAAFGDTQHTAELTGDSLPMMIAVDFGNPEWLQFSLKTAVLMRDLWMGTNTRGWFQFRSNHLSATQVGTGGTAEDSWVNFRAVMPALWVWWYSQDPEVGDLLVRWADTWVRASLSTDKGKPRGTIPAGIGWPDGEIGGLNAPTWYTAAHPQGSVNYDWAPQNYKSYIVTLLETAYEATGNLTFLEPLRLEAEMARDYLRDPVPAPREGSREWAGMILGQGSMDRYQRTLDKYGLPGSSATAVLWDPDSVVSACIEGHGYIQKCYPLMTTEASATDRVAFVGIPNPFLIYTGGDMGGAMLSPSFTYSGLGMDFAAMVRTTNTSGGAIVLYGFFDGTREAGLVPWALEPGARYALRGGPDANGDGLPDTVEFSTEFVFSSRGMEVPFTLPGRTVFSLRVEKIADGAGWALLPDPAFGNDDPVTVDRENATVTVTLHNLGAAPAAGVVVHLTAVTGEGDRSIVAEGTLGELPRPTGLRPLLTEMVLNITAMADGVDHYLLIIDPDGGLLQITTRNDERRIDAAGLDLAGIRPRDGEPDGPDAIDPGNPKGIPPVVSALLVLLAILLGALFTVDRWLPWTAKGMKGSGR